MMLHQAIYQLNPSVVSITDTTAYDVNGNVVEYDLAAAESLVQANQYKTQRAAEYPSFADQFDLLYHGGLDAWKAAIDAVKAKYPKGTV